jgi:hypothetical protein
LKLPEQYSKRRKFTPAKLIYRQGTAAQPDEVIDCWTGVRAALCSALDLMVSAIDERFNNPGLKLAAGREELLMKCTTDSQLALTDVHLKALCLPKSFDLERLVRQMKQLYDFIQAEKKTPQSLKDLSVILSTKDKVLRQLFNEVEKYICLCLCLPSSNASSERGMSVLRTLKTWLRSTMTQERLTHVALMDVHADRLESIHVEKLIAAFISKTSERRCVFGNP